MTVLSIGNVTGLITREIEQAPNDMMVRELIQNAIENSKYAAKPSIMLMETDPADFGIIEYPLPIPLAPQNLPENYGIGAQAANLPYGKKKLTFWNNGKGMSATELRKAVDLASSINKTQSILQNFGIGAKISALAVNQMGMIWVSCKDGKVSLVLLIKMVDSKSGVESYVRFDFWNTNSESSSGFTDVLDITGLDTIPWKTDEDWTAIILCGNNIAQNTAERPYSPEKEENPAWLVNDIYSRFFTIDPEIELRSFVGTSFQHKTSTRFVGVKDYIISQAQKLPEFLKYECVDIGDGIKVMYVWDGEYKNNVTASIYSHPFSRQGTFSGVVWKNELYNVVRSNDNTWRNTANELGILYNCKNFRIFVQLPDDFAGIPDAHRKKIMYNDIAKTEVKITTFAREIRGNMPEWFIDKINSYRPAQRSTSDIQNRAQQMLDNLMAKMKTSGNMPTSGSNGVNKTPSAANPKGGSNTSSSQKRVKWLGVGTNKEYHEKLPELIILRDDMEIDNSGADQIKYRAAQYTDTALYVNGTYEVLDMFVDALCQEYLDEDANYQLEIRDEARKVAEDEMAWLVFRAVVYAKAKNAKTGYLQEDIDTALKPVVLTTHADNLLGSDESFAAGKKELSKKVKHILAGLGQSDVDKNLENTLDLSTKQAIENGLLGKIINDNPNTLFS